MSLSNDRPLIPSNVTWKDAVTINNSKETTEDHQFRTVSLASAWCFARFYNLLYPFWNHCYLVGSQQFNLFTNHTIFFFAPCHICSKSRHFYFISHHFRTISHRFSFKYKVRSKSLVAFKQTGYYSNKILVFIQWCECYARCDWSLPMIYRSFSVTRSAALQIAWNKRKF